MDRIQGVTVAPGNQFTEGNPATATPATIVSAEWLNGVQEELIGVIDAASIVPSSADNGQVLDALNALYAPKVGTDSRLDTLEATATDHETRIDSLEFDVAGQTGFDINGFSGLSIADNTPTVLVSFTIPAQTDGRNYQLAADMHVSGSSSVAGLIVIARIQTDAGESAIATAPTFAYADGTTFEFGVNIPSLTISSGSSAKVVTARIQVRGGTLSNVKGEVVIRKLG